MKKYVFLHQKENLTIGALMLLIIMAFVMVRFQYTTKQNNSDSTNITTSKTKVTTPHQTDVPHFLPAL